MSHFAIEFDAWTGAGVETLRFATASLVTGPGDIPANTAYPGKIMDAGGTTRSILEGGAVVGRPATSTGGIVLNNGDGALDRLLNYGLDGRAFTLREVGDGQSPAQAPVVARGVLAGATATDTQRITLRLRDLSAALAVPLLTARYAGTTTSAGLGVEGDASLKDTPKPLVLGRVESIAPKCVNLFDLVYQVSIGATVAIIVYDGAVPLTQGPDFPTVAALLAWTQVGKQYATCLAAGYFRLGSDPFFTVTADVTESTALADRSAARVAARILDRLGIPAAQRDAATFDALHAFNPAEVGVYVDGESTAADIAGQVLASIGAALVPTALGVFQTVALALPTGAPVAAFTLRDISALALGAGSDGDGIPAWSVALTWGRIWQTLTASDLDRDGVSAARKAALLTAARTVTARDAAVRVAHPLAPEIKVDTLLANEADATAEAARLLALLKTRRDRLSITVPQRRGQVELGAVVTLRMPRFGFDAGRPMRVVSRVDDRTKRTVTLGLFG